MFITWHSSTACVLRYYSKSKKASPKRASGSRVTNRLRTAPTLFGTQALQYDAGRVPQQGGVGKAASLYKALKIAWHFGRLRNCTNNLE